MSVQEPMSVQETGFEFGVTPFYFLRHGETYESEEGILQGQSESELSARGRGTAVLAAETLSSVPLGSIYASSLKRAMMTASIVSLFTGVPVIALPGLMERHWGIYEGQPKASRPPVPNPRGVETMEDFGHRVLAAMGSIAGPSPVLVVAHSGVFRVLCGLAGLPTDSGVSVANGQVLKLQPSSVAGRAWHISVV